MKQLLKGAMVYIDGAFSQQDIIISDGVIQDIGVSVSSDKIDNILHLNGLYLIPGFVDVHVHLREPGFSYKETVSTGTMAAAKGGYTAVCSMPNLNPPPDTVEHIKQQLDIIEKTANVNVYPYACITVGQKGEGELVDFDALSEYAVAFSDDGRGVQSGELMKQAMEKAAQKDLLIAAHCEVNSLLNGGYIHDGEYAEKHGHKGICSASEYEQVARDIEIAKKTGCRYHVCHISAKETVELIRQAKKDGVKITCETGPHYLTMTDMDLQEDGRFKMNPPLRSEQDRLALIEGVLDSTIDVIATDHAPHSREEKAKGLAGSAMGVVGLETSFAVLYTKLVKTGVITLEKLVEMMSVSPRKIFGLGNGKIAVGEKADFAVLDLDSEYEINPDTFLSKGRATPFEGWKVQGENIMTMIEGKIVWQKNTTKK